MQKFAAMFKARTMEFVRDRGTFLWNLLFPMVLVFGFAFAFSGDNDTLFSVGVIGEPDDSMAFMEMDQIEFIRYDVSGGEVSRDEVLKRLRQHELDMVLDFAQGAFYVNTESSSGPVLRQLLATSGEGGSEISGLSEQQVSGEPIRLVDWLVPGVIGMNMMFSSLFGVGFVLVRYRKNGVLKRLKATPVSALNFVSAQAASRFSIVIITSTFVYVATNAFLGFRMEGSYLDLFVITALAVICMISIGLVFASRLKSEELANGLMNLVTFPMIILSGVFFSLEGSPQILRSISRALPLTHFIEGARGIMLEGATFFEVAPHMLFLAVMAVCLLFIASLLFRWE
jgi:ABC transporter DrrB family efflux protein